MCQKMLTLNIKSLKLIFPVILLTYVLGQFASDLYLPSLPIISKALGASISQVQFSISIFMLGFCCSRLFYGPLSDGIGRKSPLVVGLFLCFLGSLICAIATNMDLFLIGRFIQGAGGGAGASLAIAIIRDLVSGKELAKFHSYFAIMNVFVVASAPLVGGYVLYFLNWRANFVLLLLLSIIALIAVCCISETNIHKTHKNLHPSSIKKNFITLLSNRYFVGYALCRFATYAGILAWLTTCPVLLHILGVNAIGIGWLAATAGVAFVIGGYINAKFVIKLGAKKMIYYGLSIAMFAGIVLFIFGVLHMINIISVMFPVLLYMFGASLVSPNAFAGAMNPFPKIAGIAAAVMGAIQIFGGFISSSIIALLPKNTLFPLGEIFLACSLIILLMSKTLLTDKIHR